MPLRTATVTYDTRNEMSGGVVKGKIPNRPSLLNPGEKLRCFECWAKLLRVCSLLLPCDVHHKAECICTDLNSATVVVIRAISCVVSCHVSPYRL
jgi:hypothetical protein